MFALTQEEAGEWQRRVQGENKKEKYFFLFLQKITTSIDSPSDFQVVALSWGSVAPPQPPGQCQPGFVATLVLKVYKSKQSWAKFFLQLCSRSVFATFCFFFSRFPGFWLLWLPQCSSSLPSAEWTGSQRFHFGNWFDFVITSNIFCEAIITVFLMQENPPGIWMRRDIKRTTMRSRSSRKRCSLVFHLCDDTTSSHNQPSTSSNSISIFQIGFDPSVWWHYIKSQSTSSNSISKLVLTHLFRAKQKIAQFAWETHFRQFSCLQCQITSI